MIVVGARPNFMKIAPIVRNAASRKIKANFRIFHTGQHYDENMNGVFLGNLIFRSLMCFLREPLGVMLDRPIVSWLVSRTIV